MALADLTAKAQQSQAQTASISFPDEVIVLAPAYGQDAVNGPTQEGGTAVTMACKVARASKTMNVRFRDEAERMGTFFGQHQYVISFPSDPGIYAAGTRIKVTKDSLGVALSRRPLLDSIGAAEWPSGEATDWVAYAIWHDGTEDASTSPPSPGPDGIPDPGAVEPPAAGAADATFAVAAGTYLLNDGSSVAYAGGTVPVPAGDKAMYVWLDAAGNLFVT